MREFGEPIGASKRAEIVTLAQTVFDQAGFKRPVRASEFAMNEQPDRVVVYEVDLRHEGERLRVAATQGDARPPFEWLLEITSDVGESDYFKHYLVRDGDIVLALRKVLTPIDLEEARLLLYDLQTAKNWV